MAGWASTTARAKQQDGENVLQVFCSELKNHDDMLLNDVMPDGHIISDSGAFIVKRATLHDMEYVAAKVLRIHPNCYSAAERFEVECKFVLHILKSSVHPNVLRMFGFTKYHTGNCPHLIMELMPKSLTRFIEENAHYKQPYYKPELKLHIARDIANGLTSQYLHSNSPPYIHCSLTCNNVLLTAGLRAKISNFSRVKVENEDCSSPEDLELVSYLPPEVLDGTSNISRGCVDMYAYAKVLYYLATSTLPPPFATHRNDYNEERFQYFSTLDQYHRHLYIVAAQQIIQQVNPERRMPANEAFAYFHREIGPVVPPPLDVSKPYASINNSSLHSQSGPGYASTSEPGSDHTGATNREAPPKLKDKPLTENQLNTIALHNVYDWEVLARTLGLTDIQIKDIDSDYKQSSISKKCAMLNVWRQMYDDQATIQRLLDALCNMGRKADATKVLRRLESEYNIKGHSTGKLDRVKEHPTSSDPEKQITTTEEVEIEPKVVVVKPGHIDTSSPESSLHEQRTGSIVTSLVESIESLGHRDLGYQELPPTGFKKLKELMKLSHDRMLKHEEEYYGVERSGSDNDHVL